MQAASAVLPLVTRRNAIRGLAIAAGALTVPLVWAGQSNAPQGSPAKAAEVRTSLRQEVELASSPQRIYEILVDAKQFAACTGMPAEIESKPGGAFSTFGGMIEGRTIEMVPGRRLVQAWRPTHWDAGVFSIVRFDLNGKDAGTLVVLNHSSFPEGEFDSLSSGWKSHYWEPLKKYLAQAKS